MSNYEKLTQVVSLMIQEAESSWLQTVINMAENEIIRQRGYTDGVSAGTWVFDGNTQEAHFTRIIQGIDEGDPEYLDMLPRPSIGGEFAGNMTWDDILFEDLNWPRGVEFTRDDTAELLQIYSDAFDAGVLAEIRRYGKAMGNIK